MPCGMASVADEVDKIRSKHRAVFVLMLAACSCDEADDDDEVVVAGGGAGRAFRSSAGALHVVLRAGLPARLRVLSSVAR